MKKLLFTLTIGATLALAACSGEDTESNGGETSEVSTENSTEVSSEASEVSFADATVGDEISNDYGTYEIVKVSEDVGSFETGVVSFDVPKAFLAKFTPDGEDGFLLEDAPNVDGKMNVVVTLVSAENSGEEYVTFSPFNAKSFVGGSKPYGAQMYLNEGDSDVSAGDSQDFVTAYNVEDEDLAEVSKVKIEQRAPSSDNRSQGEDVEFTITFE